jgi:ParB-like chromosome segregation protein Spo0J
VIEIVIDQVTRGSRVRGIDENRVTALMASIRDVGLLNPITVAPHPLVRKDGWILISGLHRLKAMERLGRVTIDATVKDLSGAAAVIAECDENLCGSNLSSAERALFTKRRKAAYLDLHPETAAHVAGAHAANRSMGHASANLAPAFTADAAAKTRQPERTIQRDAQRGEKIPLELLQQIVGTPLDKGVVLDRLTKADSPERELDIIKREREAEKARPRESSVSNQASARLTPVSSTKETQIASTLQGRSSSDAEAVRNCPDRQRGPAGRKPAQEVEANDRQFILFETPMQLGVDPPKRGEEGDRSLATNIQKP